MELDWIVIDINGYPQHIQNHIKQLTEDPGRSLDEVTDVIVLRLPTDSDYCVAEVQICNHVTEADLLCTLLCGRK